MIEDLKERVILDNKFYKVTNNDVLFKASNHKGQYLRVQNKAHYGMHILPVLKDGSIGLINEFRYGVMDWELAVVKGGAIAGQSILENTNMELREETGYKTENISVLGACTEMASITTLKTYHIIAHECVLDGTPSPEAGEVIDSVRFYSPETVVEMISSGRIRDIATIALFYRYLFEVRK